MPQILSSYHEGNSVNYFANATVVLFLFLSFSFLFSLWLIPPTMWAS